MTIDLDRITANISFDHFAEPITFNGSEARGIAGQELVSLDGYEGMVDERVTLEVMPEEVGSVKQGMPVVVRGKSYVVDRLMEGVTNFELTRKVLLR